MTNEELINEWDARNPIKTVMMGGKGDAYEQVIHEMGMEILRYMVDNPFPWDTPDDIFAYVWGKYVTKMERNPQIQYIEGITEPSGAQYNAALNLASVYARNGYEKGLDMASEDRIIEITKQ